MPMYDTFQIYTQGNNYILLNLFFSRKKRENNYPRTCLKYTIRENKYPQKNLQNFHIGLSQNQWKDQQNIVISQYLYL